MSFFISFEGPEGSGKTTQAELLAEFLEERGHTVNLTREPGGTSLSEKIRDLLLDPDHEDMNARTELFLYLAARSQHVSEKIQPALDRGEVVICDRFTDASLVYQGIGRDLGLKRVRELNQFATNDLEPDLTFILDVPMEQGLSEARKRSRTRWNTQEGDRMEQETDEFHASVRDGYRKIAEKNPQRYSVLTRKDSIDDTQKQVRERVMELIGTHAN
ncbi:MAG: dTMP kinase [bacterium]